MALRRDGKIESLQHLPLFSGLSRRHLKVIAGHVDRVKLDAGAVLAREGRLAREFVLIVDGSAQVERDGTVITRLGTGDFFGEIPLLEGKPHGGTVIAATPVVLVVAEARSFSYLLGAVPELQRRLLVGLCVRLREAEAAWPGSISRALPQVVTEMSQPPAFPAQA